MAAARLFIFTRPPLNLGGEEIILIKYIYHPDFALPHSLGYNKNRAEFLTDKACVIAMRKRIANLTSITLNPFLVGIAVILLLSFASTTSTADAFKWWLLLITVSILPVFLVTFYLAQSGRIDGIFIAVRQQRTRIYILSSVCVLAGFIILYLCKAPPTLMAVFAAGLLAAVIFMGINMWWKISLHSAFIAASTTALVILYGWIGSASAVLIPLMGWSRIELKYHSLAQVTTGALLAILIVVVVFYLFGLT